jgi:hypothetical protein
MTRAAEAETPRLALTDKWRAQYALACAHANEALDLRTSPAPPTEAGAEKPEWIVALERGEELTRPLIIHLLDARLNDPSSATVQTQLADGMVNPAVLLIACLWALRSPLPKHAGLDVPQRGDDESLRYRLREAPPFDEATNPDVAEKLDHAALVAYVGPTFMMSSPAAAYAAVCHYAVDNANGTHGTARRSAFELLTFAITDPTLREWARHDPFLVSLRETAEWRSLFPETKEATESAGQITENAD